MMATSSMPACGSGLAAAAASGISSHQDDAERWHEGQALSVHHRIWNSSSETTSRSGSHTWESGGALSSSHVAATAEQTLQCPAERSGEGKKKCQPCYYFSKSEGCSNGYACRFC